MKKDDVVEVLSGKVIAVHRGACHVALDMADRFKDAPAERHISGAQVPKFLDTYLTAEERRFVELGGGKSSLFGDRGVE